MPKISLRCPRGHLKQTLKENVSRFLVFPTETAPDALGLVWAATMSATSLSPVLSQPGLHARAPAWEDQTASGGAGSGLWSAPLACAPWPVFGTHTSPDGSWSACAVAAVYEWKIHVLSSCRHAPAWSLVLSSVATACTPL